MNEKTKARIRSAVERFAARNDGMLPTVSEVASNIGKTVAVVASIVDEEDSGMSLTWSGPRPRGASGMLVAIEEVEDEQGQR